MLFDSLDQLYSNIMLANFSKIDLKLQFHDNTNL